MTVRDTCVTGYTPNDLATYAPFVTEFAEDDDFLEAPQIEQIAMALIDHYPEFAHLQGYSIAYFWKKEASTQNEKKILGEAKKLSGITKHVIESTFMVIIAADEARYVTNLQLEALVYHELCHLAEKFDDKGNAKPAIKGHDTEMFRAEIYHYGFWKPDLKSTAKAFRQIPLDADADDRVMSETPVIGKQVAEHMTKPGKHLDAMQRMADKDGTTMTITAAGKSVTIAPRKTRTAAKT